MQAIFPTDPPPEYQVVAEQDGTKYAKRLCLLYITIFVCMYIVLIILQTIFLKFQCNPDDVPFIGAVSYQVWFYLQAGLVLLSYGTILLQPYGKYHNPLLFVIAVRFSWLIVGLAGYINIIVCLKSNQKWWTSIAMILGMFEGVIWPSFVYIEYKKKNDVTRRHLLQEDTIIDGVNNFIYHAV